MIDRIDFLIYDRIVSYYLHPYKEVTKVFIVDIDDESIAKEGRWPWPRNKLARLLATLQTAGVVTVGVDIIMSNPEINYATGLEDRLSTISRISGVNENPKQQVDQTLLVDMLEKIAPEVDNDQALANSLQSYDVTLGFLFHELSNVQVGTLPAPLTNVKGQVVTPNEFNAQDFKGYNASLDMFIKASGHGGFVSNIPDSDGVIRNGLVLGSINGKVYPSLALMTAMRFLLADSAELKMKNSFNGKKLYGVDISGTFVPTNDKGQILIPFWGLQFTLPYISATDILHGNFDPSALAGTVAIVGSSAFMLGDLHPAPAVKLFPGVEMVANMVAGIIDQQLTTPYDWRSVQGISIITGAGIFLSLLIPFLSILWMIITVILLSLIIISVCVLIFYYKNIFVSVAYLLVLIFFQAMVNYSYEFILEKRQKYRIKKLFGQYVPESYVQLLVDSPSIIPLEGQNSELTVLFSDIRNFTDTCEGLSAMEVKRLLNTLFTPITQNIFNHQGTIDKYVGDMVMAFWGAPVPIENNRHAYQAVLCALRIFKDLPFINDQMVILGLPRVSIGIGIGTGLMNIGDMGSDFRRSYTVLGDNVNLASRLESLTKFYEVKILVSEATRENQEEFLWRAIDKVTVKGRKKALTIYEPLGLLSEVSPALIEEVELYQQALELYYDQNWDAAFTLFIKLQKDYSRAYLYQLYQTRIEGYKESPPSADWDGVFVHTKK